MRIQNVRALAWAASLMASGCTLLVSQVAAQSTTAGFRSLDYQGATGTAASGINSSAEVVGWYFDQAGNRHGFLYDGATFASRDFSTSTAYQGINDNAEIVGYYVDQAMPPVEHGFLYSGWTLTSTGFSGGTFSAIDYPGSTGTMAAGINNNGQIVGHYVDQAGTKHGFLYSGGSFTSIDYPGSTSTLAYGINKKGQIVGVYYDQPDKQKPPNEHGFLYSAGTFSSVDYPGSTGTSAEGINDSGRVVGHYFDKLGAHGFLDNGGRLRSLNYPGATDTRASGIDNRGEIVGIYYDEAANEHGFILNPTLIDPATPDPVAGLLVSNGQVVNDPARLAESQNIVVGIAADGVAQLVVRIPAANVGDHMQLSIWNDQKQLSRSPKEDGYLTSLDGQQDSRASGMIDVAAVDASNSSNTSTTPMVFAVYHAPPDFARQSTPSDQSIVTRNVSVASATAPIFTFSIVRPPVLFIHGLWSDETTWTQFKEAMEAQIPNLATYPVDYSCCNGESVAFNTPFVLVQALDQLTAFKTTNNVAAAQFDFIVHSMGGLIANNMDVNPLFKKPSNFGKGIIHKLITIDTPYMGSPWATGFDQSTKACKLLMGAAGAKVGGAIHDLAQGSQFYATFNPVPPDYYKHSIAGIVTVSESILASTAVNKLVPPLVPFHVACYSVFNPPVPFFDINFFFGDSSDLIVSRGSQLGPFAPPNNGEVVSKPGVAHFHIGIPLFGGVDLTLIPSVLDSVSGIPTRAITLLNTPVSDSSFIH